MYKQFCDQCEKEIHELQEYQHLNTEKIHVEIKIVYPENVMAGGGNRYEKAVLCSYKCAVKWLDKNTVNCK
jgi:hypothetical protein